MGRCFPRVFTFLLLVVALWFTVPTLALAAKTNRAPVASISTEEVMSTYTFRPGTVFLCLAQTPVHTGQNQLNDPVEGRLVHDVYVGERTVIRSAVRFVGHISVLEPPIEGRDAILGIRMDRIELPGGESIPVRAYVDTGDPSHTWGGGLTEGTVPKAVQFRVWGIGEYNKTVMSGPRQPGREYKVDLGEYWRVVLEQPLSVPIVNRRRYSP
jgi:hypothetical protein